MKPMDKLLAKVDALFVSPTFDDKTGLPEGMTLSASHKALLMRRNGGYFYGGALHIFGACAQPAIHSLRAWNEANTWRHLFGELTAGLTFFAENAFGDQFAFLEDGQVVEFHAETGDIEIVSPTFEDWLLIAAEAPDELLSRPIVAEWCSMNGHLPHGSQLQAYPPFAFADEDTDLSVDAVAALENMEFHAQIVQQLQSIPEGIEASIEFTDEGLQISYQDAPTPS